MSVTGTRTPGTRLLAAVVLSACVGLVGGGLGAWAVFSHFGPTERVITETKTGAGAVSVGGIATAVEPSLVTVSTGSVSPAALAAGDTSGLTQGFAISGNGLVMTSAHAVHGATRLRIATADGHGYDATIAATDVADGVVVLRATGSPPLTPLHFATAVPRIGDLGVVVFHPALGPLTARSGVVAAVGMSAGEAGATIGDLVAVDATPAPLADGAPLVDGSGAVVGIVTVVTSAPGVVAASGRDGAALLAAVQRGSPAPSTTFGVTTVLVGASVAGATALPQGALVEAVAVGGPAAGLLQPGDIVAAVNGAPVVDPSGLVPTAFGLVAGDTARLRVTGPTGSVRTVAITVATG